MSRMSRNVKDPAERRAELLAAARHFFYTKGYESTSVSDIVGEVGVAQGTFYYYFDSKEALLEALVEAISETGVAVLRRIVADEELGTLEKWNQAMGQVASWKLTRKAEMLALLRVMMIDENRLLRQRLREYAIQLLAPEFAQIIEQGVREGVFNTAYVTESPEIILSIVYSVQDFLAAILLDPGAYEEPVLLVQRKLAAVTNAVERVLGAPTGSLRLIDADKLVQWLEDAG